MYKIRNVWADQQYEEGASSLFEHQRRWTNLEIEPYVNGYRLNIYHELVLTDEQYNLQKDYFEPYIKAKILKIIEMPREEIKEIIEAAPEKEIIEEKIKEEIKEIIIEKEIKEEIKEEEIEDKKKKKLKK